jgi:hypothetical protein
MKISSNKLTQCRVTSDGEIIELDFVDPSNTAVSVHLPFEQAEAVVMTLPHLLKRALKRRTGSQDARYVFGIGNWMIEETKDANCLLVTLTTGDGFEVCFSLSFDSCQALGWNLMHHAERVREARDLTEESRAPDRIAFN